MLTPRAPPHIFTPARLTPSPLAVTVRLLPATFIASLAWPAALTLTNVNALHVQCVMAWTFASSFWLLFGGLFVATATAFILDVVRFRQPKYVLEPVSTVTAVPNDPAMWAPAEVTPTAQATPNKNAAVYIRREGTEGTLVSWQGVLDRFWTPFPQRFTRKLSSSSVLLWVANS